MKIKSLLIGSAALMTVSTGAQAADAIVYADPEPVEYVRVCDVYGAGFFYIPGTETCLKIGGYVRYQMNMGAGFNTLNKQARFAPTFDARTETEWGTLRGFTELEIDWGWAAAQAAGGNTTVAGFGQVLLPGGGSNAGYVQNFNIAHAFIELTNSTGTLRIGRTHTPYSRFLGYGSGNANGAVYGFQNTSEISYTFSGGNGFSAIVALIEDPADNDWMPDIEGGVNFAQGWGSVGAIVGYDESTANWGAKGVFRFAAPNSGVSGGLHVFYASGPGTYAITDPGAAAAAGAHWSVLGHIKGQFSPKVAAVFSAQWFNYTGGWQFVGGLDLTPVSGLRIRPEVVYNTSNTTWTGLVRFDRNF